MLLYVCSVTLVCALMVTSMMRY